MQKLTQISYLLRCKSQRKITQKPAQFYTYPSKNIVNFSPFLLQSTLQVFRQMDAKESIF